MASHSEARSGTGKCRVSPEDRRGPERPQHLLGLRTPCSASWAPQRLRDLTLPAVLCSSPRIHGFPTASCAPSQASTRSCEPASGCLLGPAGNGTVMATLWTVTKGSPSSPPMSFVSAPLQEVTWVNQWSGQLPVFEMLLLPASNVFPVAARIPVHSGGSDVIISPR